MKNGIKIFGIIALFALLAISCNAKKSVQESTPNFPDTYEETIKLFPANLRDGFYGMYVVISSTTSEKEALQTMHTYYLINWMKINYITKGRGAEDGPNNMTVLDWYTQQRTQLLVSLGTMPMAALRYGNPGGTDWDVWYQQLMAWL